MMQTTFFNVGHGEAIFIELLGQNPYGIVRDLGRSKFAKTTTISMNIDDLLVAVRNCSCRPTTNGSKNVDAILSHAHEDHFNGFTRLYYSGLRKVFQNSYIPWLCLKDLTSLGGLLIKYSLLLYKFYGPTHPVAAKAKHWLLAAPIMAALSENLWCVCAGHHVSHWPSNNRILWPPPCSCGGNFIDKLKSGWKRYLYSNELPGDFLQKEADKIRKELQIYYRESENLPEGFFNDERINNSVNFITTILDELHETQTEPLSSPGRLSTYVYDPNIDNHSLMFEVGDSGRESLFLSDADDATIESMLLYNGLDGREYYVIKSSHHGTRGAKPLMAHNILCEFVVNCCGPAHGNWWGPDADYTNISDKVICTDWKDGHRKWMNRDQYTIWHKWCLRL